MCISLKKYYVTDIMGNSYHHEDNSLTALINIFKPYAFYKGDNKQEF